MTAFLLKAYLATLLAFSLTAAHGLSQEKGDVPHKVEIVLNTDGDLSLRGTGDKTGGITTDKDKNPVNDNLVKQYDEAKETKIFTTKTEAKKNMKHEKLTISVPDGSLLSLQTLTGDVTLNNLNASVSGFIQSGNLVLNGMKGEVNLVSGHGNITAVGVEAHGTLIAREGDISLTDVTGGVLPFAPNGSISLSIGPDYYRKSSGPLAIDLSEGQVQVAMLPNGGTIRLVRGTLAVSAISEPLTIRADSATIVLRGVSAPVNLMNRGLVSIQLDKFKESKETNQPVVVEVVDGEVTVELTKNFSGVLQIWSTEVNPKNNGTSVTSSSDLGKATVVENKSWDGQTIIRESSYTKVVGKGGPTVAIRVTNSKVTIKD